ncbi:nickel-dependent lactate racemase family protein [Pseudothermotoga sp.]|nr:nickel-dependent lactate racemase [Pseudothermotoga sp.]MCX7812435.1 nickel-dependent lactate racemase [Pseudothermotoga sp.]MDW8140111.1 nickel-dependent lactate racemase [Pseudothermotoga sp.]
MQIKLPYDKDRFLEVEIPEQNILAIARARFPEAVKDPISELKRSFRNPIASPKLGEILGKKSKVAIVVTDMTRHAMDGLVSELLLEEIHSAGVPKKNVYFLIALGTHRPMNQKEIEEKLGEKIVNEYAIYNHDCHNGLTDLGQSSAGFPMKISKKLMEADVKITVGVIEPHLFAGYSGGVKTICVGLAGIETIGATHSLKVLSDPRTRLGVIEGNVFRDFLNEMAQRVKIDFTVNLVLNEEKQLTAAFSGHPIESFNAAVKFTKSFVEVPVQGVADVVISCPGFPKSVNLYQATRAANTVVLGPKPVVKRGGLILIPARCEDGLGDENYYKFMSSFDNFENLREHIFTKGFEIGEHKAYVLTKILSHASIVMSDCEIDDLILRKMYLLKVSTLQEGIDQILKENPRTKFLVMPNGVHTIPILEG